MESDQAVSRACFLDAEAGELIWAERPNQLLRNVLILMADANTANLSGALVRFSWLIVSLGLLFWPAKEHLGDDHVAIRPELRTAVVIQVTDL